MSDLNYAEDLIYSILDGDTAGTSNDNSRDNEGEMDINSVDTGEDNSSSNVLC